MATRIHWDKFLRGMKYAFAAEAIVITITAILWLIFSGGLEGFPIGVFLFGSGGFMLTVAGCIGPGRYHKDYKLLIYTPEPGASFSNDIPVSGFTMDPTIKEADIIVNGKKVGTIGFDENGMGNQVITRKDFISEIINSIQFRFESEISNSNDFTLFEYNDEMSEEEIDDLYQMETKKPLKSLEDAKASYLQKTSKGLGSVALGLGAMAAINFILNVLLGFINIYY
ncbi:MAG: hypothetical protein ACXAE3_01610 [Candidatus Kariarchaeaceae archaeon]|jgi:hypothetical protein